MRVVPRVDRMIAVCVHPQIRVMFISPVQSALLQGSPCIDGFHVLIIGLPQSRDKEEREAQRVSEWPHG